MLKVAHLIKFLSEINPHTSPVRLSLYNFAKSFHLSDEPLTAHFFNHFFEYTLDFAHWSSNKNQLSHEVQFLIKNFNAFYQNKFDTSEIKFPDTLQIVEIDSTPDLIAVLENYLKTLCQNRDQYRLVNDQKKYFGFILKASGEIEVHQFDKKMVIKNGFLQPLRSQIVLSFNNLLELSPNKSHFVEISPHNFVQFYCRQDRLYGSLTRGYMFQKVQEIQGEKLTELPRVFWAIKRIEQFFVTRETDAYYLDLYKKLNDIKSGLWEKNSESWVNYISLLLSQADSALENVYIGDKPLEILINEVRQIFKFEKSEPCQNLEPKPPML